MVLLLIIFFFDFSSTIEIYATVSRWYHTATIEFHGPERKNLDFTSAGNRLCVNLKWVPSSQHCCNNKRKSWAQSIKKWKQIFNKMANMRRYRWRKWSIEFPFYLCSLIIKDILHKTDFMFNSNRTKLKMGCLKKKYSTLYLFLFETNTNDFNDDDNIENFWAILRKQKIWSNKSVYSLTFTK